MAPRSPSRPRVALVGTGRLARAIVGPLAKAGYPLAAIAGRRRSATAAVGRGLDVERRTTELATAARSGTLVLLAVADDALPAVAAALTADSAIAWGERVVLHFAGALGPAVLEPLGALGASVGVLHPLQCLGGGRGAGDALAGSRARIEGDDRARRVARRLARDLELEPLVARRGFDDADRAAYHAAASLASNDLVALFWDAESLMIDAGFSRRAARDGLVALVRGTLDQIESGGPGAALSGPVPRGDVETLERHLDRLATHSPDLALAHRGLALRLARLTRRVTGARLERLLRHLRRRAKPSGRDPGRGV